MGRAAVSEVLGRLGLLAIALVVVHYDLGLVWMFVALIVGNLLTALWNWMLVRTLARIRWAYDRATWLAILSRSWPIAMSIAFNLVYLKGDVLVLSLTRSSSEVGLYGAAYKILDVLTVVPMMFMGLVLPLLTRAWTTKDKPDFNRILQRSFDFLALIAMPLIVGTWVVGRDLMDFFASAAFGESGRLLGILIIAGGAVFFGSMFGHATIALGRQKAAVKWYAADAVLSLLGYLLFVPRWGAPAAAWVTVFSEVFIAASIYLVVRQTSQFAPKLSGAAKSIAAASLMGLVILILPGSWHVLIRIALGIVLYGVAALTFGAVTPAQLKELRPKKA